jgi:uncharacterized damage-inducible protein DinB
MNLPDLRDLFAYTEWANALVLNAVADIDDPTLRADRKISHGSILGTLTHMAGAEWIWLERWRGQSHTGPGVWASWSPDAFADVAALRQTWRALETARGELLAALTDAELQVPRTFKRIDGTEMTLPLVEQMLHVVNHATMHRGQLVGMIRQLGRTPPSTDLMRYYGQRRR